MWMRACVMHLTRKITCDIDHIGPFEDNLFKGRVHQQNESFRCQNEFWSDTRLWSISITNCNYCDPIFKTIQFFVRGCLGSIPFFYCNLQSTEWLNTHKLHNHSTCSFYFVLQYSFHFTLESLRRNVLVCRHIDRALTGFERWLGDFNSSLGGTIFLQEFCSGKN